jgi:mycothiol system anti-sigma-R factor
MGQSCEQALRELYSFLDGALTVERRTVISAHIDECSECLDVFGFESELRQVIAMRCREEVPESLRMRILEVIQATTLEIED